jgi:hypothetical protein
MYGAGTRKIMTPKADSNTPPLDTQEKIAYLRDHLSNELRWLLDAATGWAVQEQLNLRIEGFTVQVYAMDSVFVHARSLFEFFARKPARRSNHYGVGAFVEGVTTLHSSLYHGGWSRELHRFVMHAQTRCNPTMLQTVGGTDKPLNEMPVEFANEILRLWKEFEERLNNSGDLERQQLGALAREQRLNAINGASYVVKSEIAAELAQRRGITLKPIFYDA